MTVEVSRLVQLDIYCLFYKRDLITGYSEFYIPTLFSKPKYLPLNLKKFEFNLALLFLLRPFHILV